MNGMVDSRVVEMHFDNSDFMDKISETIAALEQLNEQISSINSVRGLSNLASGADVGLSNIENSLGNIESRFSILGIVGMTIVQRLTNAAINGVNKVASLLGAAARQARTGGFIRAENIEQAKFLLEGLGADVEAVFSRVDKAVTGTAYGIDEAARAASSFYASGITDLDKLQDSLRAVAGVAAMTGSDFASIADIFTTVAGQGKVMTMQLRMMEGRGLNAAATMRDFINKVIEHGDSFNESIRKNVQELTGGTKVSEEAVREFVNKGKIDFELFSTAMDDAFGEHAQEANKTFSGSLSNLKTSLSRLGEAFYTPAMKAAIPVFNRLRETFSNLTNELKKSDAARNIDKLIDSVKKGSKITLADLKQFDTYVDNMFGTKSTSDQIWVYLSKVKRGTIDASDEIKNAVNDIPKEVLKSSEAFEKWVDEGKLDADLFAAAMAHVTEEFKKQSNVASMVSAFSSSIQNLGNSISAIIKKFNESEIISNSAQTIYNSFRILKTIFGAVRDAFNEVFTGSAIKSLEHFTAKLADSTKKAADWLLVWQNIAPFKNVMLGIFSGLHAGINIVKGFLKVIGSGIATLFGFTGAFESVSKGFRDSMDAIDKKTGTIGIFDKLAKVLDGLGDLADKAFKKLANGFGTIIKTMGEGLGDVRNLTQAFVAFGLVLGGLSAMKNYKIIKYRLGLITGGVSRFIQCLRIADLQDMGSAIRDILDSTKRALKGFTHEIKTKILKDLSFSILALAIGLKLLETVDATKLATGLGALTVMMAEMTGVLITLLLLLNNSTLTGSMKGILAIGGVSNAMIKIAIAMLLMAAALKMIAELDPQELATGLIGLTVMLGAVLGFILLLDKYQKVAMNPGVGLMLLGVAASLCIMANAVQMLSQMNPVELAKGLGSVVVLLGAVFGFLAGLSKMKVTMGPGLIAAGIGMIAIAAAINILAPALERIGAIPLDQLAHSLEAVISAMISMAIASDMASVSGGAGMLMMAIAIASLATSLERIGSMDVNTIAKGFITIAIAIGIMVAATAVLSAFSGTLLIVGGAMLMFSASVALFGAGLVLIGTGLTTISAGIMSFSAVTVTAIETFIQAITTMIVQLANAVPTILEAMLSNLVKVMEILNEYTPEIVAFLTKLLDMLIEVIVEYAPKLIATGVELGIMLILGLLEGLANSMQKIVTKAVDVIVAFVDGVSANLDKIIKSGITLVIAFINGLANGIRQNAEAVRAAVWNLCTAILEAFMTFFGIHSPSTVMETQGFNLMQGLINGILGMGGAVVSAIVTAISKAFARAKNFGARFISAGRTIIQAIISGIKAKATQIGSNIRTALQKGLQAVSNFVGRFVTSGLNLVKGIARGIKNGVSHVISAAGDIARRALDKFKSKLGISSPSKVFASAAKWIPEGIVVGINSTSKKVENAMGSLADNTVNAMSDAVAKAYDVMRFNDDFNPTITPVLDLSQVRKEAGGIDSMFGTETVSLASSFNQGDIQNIQNNNLMNQLLTKMDRILNTGTSRQANISNTFTVNGAENPEEFVNTFINTLNREMKMRAV